MHNANLAARGGRFGSRFGQGQFSSSLGGNLSGFSSSFRKGKGVGAGGLSYAVNQLGLGDVFEGINKDRFKSNAAPGTVASKPIYVQEVKPKQGGIT